MKRPAAKYKNGETLLYIATGQHVTISWESNGPPGTKEVWYRVAFPGNRYTSVREAELAPLAP